MPQKEAWEEKSVETRIRDGIFGIMPWYVCAFHVNRYDKKCLSCKEMLDGQKRYELFFKLISEERKRAQEELLNQLYQHVLKEPINEGPFDTERDIFRKVGLATRKAFKDFAQSLGLSIKE